MVGGLQDWRLGRVGRIGKIREIEREKGLRRWVLGCLGGHLRSFLRICVAWRDILGFLGELWRSPGALLGGSWASFGVLWWILGAFGGHRDVPWISFGTLSGCLAEENDTNFGSRWCRRQVRDGIREFSKTSKKPRFFWMFSEVLRCTEHMKFAENHKKHNEIVSKGDQEQQI